MKFEGMSTKFKESAMPEETIELEGDVRSLNRSGKVSLLKIGDSDHGIDSNWR
jgi:dihydroxyacetone kinase